MPTGIPLSTIAATIHHGIDIGDFTFTPDPGSYLAFFGRIHPDKGVVAAIDAADATGIPLRIAGIIQDEAYFEREIVPRLDDDQVQFVGPVPAEDRSPFLGGAMALLHLIDFDEPFGFSVVEAMACGTPVIAFDRGSMPELIIDGVTGSFVSDVHFGGCGDHEVGQLDRGLFEPWPSSGSAATAWSTTTSRLSSCLDGIRTEGIAGFPQNQMRLMSAAIGPRPTARPPTPPGSPH